MPDLPDIDAPKVSGVIDSDVEDFILLMLDGIARTYKKETGNDMTPADLIDAMVSINRDITNGTISPQVINTVANLANGNFENGQMLVFLNGTAVPLFDAGHVAAGVMTPDGSLVFSTNGKDGIFRDGSTLDERYEDWSFSQMMAWAYENNYTRIFATSTDNYDMNAAMMTADYYRSLAYNLASDNCWHATEAILESFTANGLNDIRDFATSNPSVTHPEDWAYQLKEDGWLEPYAIEDLQIHAPEVWQQILEVRRKTMTQTLIQ